MSEQQSGDPAGFDVGEELTVYDVARLYEALTPQLATDEPLTIDLSKVTTVDSAGIQLLVSAVLSARNRQKICRVSAVSDELSQALGSLGLLDQIQSEG